MPQYMTTKELADYLKVAEITVFRWRDKGLPFKKIGKTVRFVVEDVNKWLEQQNENK